MPKKKFRKSVQRHHIRRLMVEAWRINKQVVYNAVPEGQQLHLFILYTASEIADYNKLTQAMQKGIAQMKAAVQ